MLHKFEQDSSSRHEVYLELLLDDEDEEDFFFLLLEDELEDDLDFLLLDFDLDFLLLELRKYVLDSTHTQLVLRIYLSF